jgi:hypothetical protein
MSEVSTAFMAGRLSTETCKCNSFNLDRIFGNDSPSRLAPIYSRENGLLSHRR